MLFKKQHRFVLSSIFVLLVVSHFLYWRQYSFKAIVLESALVLTTNKQNTYDLVGICNKLKYFSCSNYLLKQLLQKHPGDSLALFNLAYVAYKKNNWKLSAAYFQNYFSLKEDNIQAYLLYSKVLQKLNKNQEAINILYWGLSNKRDASLVQELVILLNATNHSTEALSLLFNINNSKLQERVVFKKKNHANFNRYGSLSKLLAFSKKRFAENLFKHSAPLKNLRLFSIRGENFFIPVRLNKVSSPQAVQLVAEKKSITQKKVLNKISLSFLEENYFFLQEELKVGNVINIPNLFIGPWKMNNVAFKICENCQSKLYIQSLPLVTYKFTKQYILNFLNLFI
ncbi:MAG: hypothetical protein HAW63_04165 [Bdellovibrionaceae bacterium]|nr:hypothetical protein [Pseudobdellovibrionaceae bacterium]